MLALSNTKWEEPIWLSNTPKSRQRKYLKTIRHYYLKDVPDDEYIDVRLASFRGHLKGTKNRIYISNRLTSLKREKRHAKSLQNNKLYDTLEALAKLGGSYGLYVFEGRADMGR